VVSAPVSTWAYPPFVSTDAAVADVKEVEIASYAPTLLERTVARAQEVYEWAKQRDVLIAFGTDLWGRRTRNHS